MLYVVPRFIYVYQFFTIFPKVYMLTEIVILKV